MTAEATKIPHIRIPKTKAKVPSVAFRTGFKLEAMTPPVLEKWRAASKKHGVRILLQNGATFHPSGLVTDDRNSPSTVLMKPDSAEPQIVESAKQPSAPA